MNIKLQFFGYTAEIAGQTSHSLTINDNALLNDALELLIKELPTLSSINGSTKFAINTDYAKKDSPLKDGDVLSFIPPVGGG